MDRLFRYITVVVHIIRLQKTRMRLCCHLSRCTFSFLRTQFVCNHTLTLKLYTKLSVKLTEYKERTIRIHCIGTNNTVIYSKLSFLELRTVRISKSFRCSKCLKFKEPILNLYTIVVHYFKLMFLVTQLVCPGSSTQWRNYGVARGSGRDPQNYYGVARVSFCYPKNIYII